MDRYRRRLLGLGAVLGAGLVGGPAVAATGANSGADGNASAEPRIRRRVMLGRTGLEVAEIGFGSASSSDPTLVRHALARGVDFFDAAESYRGGSAEEAIGEGLRGVPRDSVVLTSKTRAGSGASAADMMRALDGSLRRLGTDYVDIYFNHAVNNVARLRNSHWAEFTERAKAQGKIRFRGVSGHGSRLVECLDYALDHNLADVVLAAYSFAQDPAFSDRLRHTFHFVALQSDLTRVLDKAKENGVGVIAMKTLMGARLNDIRPHETRGRTFAQAALRWVLESPRVDAALISMKSLALIDEYVGASDQAGVRSPDLPLLARYASRQDIRWCRPGCDACASACPHGVEIAEVLRTRMYAVDYGDTTLARTDYAALGAGAGPCVTCTHEACRDACPFGLPIAALTSDTARRLA